MIISVLGCRSSGYRKNAEKIGTHTETSLFFRDDVRRRKRTHIPAILLAVYKFLAFQWLRALGLVRSEKEREGGRDVGLRGS